MPKIERMAVGVDPGAKGALASLYRGKVTLQPLAELTLHDLWHFIQDHCQHVPSFAHLEKVNGYGVSGVKQSAPAMFNFGTSYGGVRMALVAAGIPYEEVTANVWQKGLGIQPRQKGETKTQWKNRLKAVAQRLFPQVHLTLETCDALLLAEHCRRGLS